MMSAILPQLRHNHLLLDVFVELQRKAAGTARFAGISLTDL